MLEVRRPIEGGRNGAGFFLDLLVQLPLAPKVEETELFEILQS